MSRIASNSKTIRLAISSEYICSKINKSNSQATKFPIPWMTFWKSRYKPQLKIPTKSSKTPFNPLKRNSLKWKTNLTESFIKNKKEALDFLNSLPSKWFISTRLVIVFPLLTLENQNNSEKRCIYFHLVDNLGLATYTEILISLVIFFNWIWSNVLPFMVKISFSEFLWKIIVYLNVVTVSCWNIYRGIK